MHSNPANAPSRPPIRRAVLAALLLAAAPLLAAGAHAGAGDGHRVLRPDDLRSGVPVDAAWAEGGGTWSVLDRGAQPRFGASAPAGTTTSLSLALEGVPYFAFAASVSGRATLTFLVDGRPIATADASTPLTLDRAFDGGLHVLSWRYESRDPRAVAEVRLLGAVAVEAPVLHHVPRLLERCTGFVHLHVDFVAPLADRHVGVLFDGEPVQARTWSYLVDGSVRTGLSFRLPAGTGDGRHEVTLDVAHEAFPEPTTLRHVVEIVAGNLLWTFPGPGWIYQRQPTFELGGLGCLASEVTLTVDGEVVATSKGLLSMSYTLPRELAFGEEVTYRFDVRLRDRTVSLGGTVREGLDVVEFDLPPGPLSYAATGRVALLAAPAAPLELPAVVATPSVAMVGHASLLLDAGARVRAEYAPLELRCVDHEAIGRQCSPYGGGAPGYWTRGGHLARAEVAPQGFGHPVGLVGAGQLAAASHFSSLAHRDAPLPAAAVEGEARAALLAAEAQASAGEPTP